MEVAITEVAAVRRRWRLKVGGRGYKTAVAAIRRL
jgi:hypothetical protein